MPETGWIGEGPDATPAMPVAERMLAMRQRGPGDALALALARSRGAEAREARDEAAGARDPDEYAANLIARGYMPGMVSQLSMKLGDVVAELADEREKLERGARRAEHVRRAHEAGQIRAWDIPQLLGDDLGDEGRVAQLERQAASLRQQVDAASEAITPPRPQQLDGVEAASRRAHELFREVTRARMAEAAAGVRRSERRPFASRGGGVAARSEHCVYCTADGVTDEQSYLLHSDPEFDVPVTTPEQAQQAEVNRLQALGYSAETAQLSQRPVQRDDYGMAVR